MITHIFINKHFIVILLSKRFYIKKKLNTLILLILRNILYNFIGFSLVRLFLIGTSVIRFIHTSNINSYMIR